MPGPHTKPVELKILRMGSKRAEKLVRKITPTPGPLDEAPDWLTPEQKLDWDYAIANAPRDVLKRIDKSVLAGFIIAADTHRRATIEANRSQLLIKTPTQQLPMMNPYLPIMNRQMMLMLRAASELGFTPSARARIDSGNAPRANDMGDWEDVGT